MQRVGGEFRWEFLGGSLLGRKVFCNRPLPYPYAEIILRAERLLVPGGGLEPPRSCDLRILSLIYYILHSAAHSRNCMHNIFIYNIYEHNHDRMVLHATVQNPGSNMHQNMPQVVCTPGTRPDMYPDFRSVRVVLLFRPILPLGRFLHDNGRDAWQRLTRLPPLHARSSKG